MKTKVIRVDPQAPDLDTLAEAAACLRAGKVIAFPTETVYGIGVMKRFPQAVERIYEIKKRPREKALAYHLANYHFTSQLLLEEKVGRVFSTLPKKFWPGPLTLIVSDLTGTTYGFRMPKHLVARLLIELCGEPIVATSANRSEKASAVSPEEVLREMDGKVELLIDSGCCELARDSTVCDLTQFPYRIVRQGAAYEAVQRELDEIHREGWVRQDLLIVCTGNTCRSPMAEGWLREEIKKRGLENSFGVSSCGVFAYGGMPPSEEAIKILREEDIDIASHRAQPLTRSLVSDADLIFVMVPEHERFILNAFPHLAGRVKLLHISDPIGMPIAFYRECFENIKERFRKELPWLRQGVG